MSATIPVYKLLAKAVAGQKVNFGDLDEDEVFKTAEEQGLVPLLSDSLGEAHIEGLSEEIRSQLNRTTRQVISNDLLLQRATVETLNILAEQNIEVLLTKGSALSQLLYRQPHLRTRCDSDLFVLERDKKTTAQALADAGYHVTGLNHREHSSSQFGAAIRLVPQVPSQFDIHWKISNRYLFRETLPFDECWEEKQPVPLLGTSAWALSNRDLLIHACIHRIAHGRGTDRNRLIWLYDIHLLWNAMDEDEKQVFIKKALDKKIGAVCADALQTCDDLFTSVGGAPAATAAGGAPAATAVRGAPAATNETKTTSQSRLSPLLQNKKNEPTARLINASKPRWALADLMAVKGLKSKLAFAKELAWK